MFDPDALIQKPADWLGADGADAEIIMSSRVRLARNLDKHRFAHNCDNEELARIMGVEPIVGAHLSFMGQKGKIIGVMKDFHYHSVRTEIMPLALALGDPERLGYIGIRIQPGDI